ncbi:TatD family hydrolase [Paenibacillus sp. TRM 82003]|uniref:TatD family hydrolase n=1 Tax=Kineococcus sp. TRM81007 TaxID=2925831 RepID=UPI001F590155|nr:TatD family hydrolase [Kineococcus sp. TRM81007]MCI2238434.1 TatD family hydrolase [Kineococcus sp. TRM81007]MCI3922052.1 TatD family hydrolase [Paenibacillus sp. TRM 82003]
MSPREGSRPPAPEPLPVPVVDNHTHLDLESSPAEVAALLAAAAAAGVPRSVQIGCDLPAARWTVEAVDRHPQLLGGVAIHPNEVPGLVERGELDAALAEVRELARHPRVRVVGETGLDFFRTPPEQWHLQEESFRAHIALAKELGLALQIHDRDAHDAVLRVLAEEGAPERTVFHCFSGDAAMARACADAGYYLSFAGTVTFKNAEPLREALRAVPRDRVMVETDAPYLTPVPHRGRPNAGYLVPLTVRSMARTLGADLEELCGQLAATTEAVYGPW